MNILKELQVLPFVVGLAIGLAASPAFAQNYSYNYGSSRVTNQGSIGLNNHDSSYISPGTMSDSARGVNRGYALNPNLPSVPLGRNVKTAGDNFYYGNAPDKIKPTIPRKVMYRVNNQQNQQGRQNRPQGNVYYPGQNANASIQRGAGGALQYNSSGGAITYADTDASSNSNQKQNNQTQNQNQNQNQNNGQ